MVSKLQTLLDMLKKAKDDYEKHGMSVVDDPNLDMEEDEAEKWLKENEGKEKEPAPKEKGKAEKVYSKDWEPRKDYTDKHKEDIKRHMDDGYSHREAERMAGAHKGPRDYQSALKSGVNPSLPSDKMMGHYKDLAKEWLDKHREMDLAEADEHKNPMKHAAGQMEQAHKKHTADYHGALSDFLSSDNVKGMKPRERHQAVNEWKSKWKQDNPDYHEGLGDVSQVQSKFKAAAQNIEEKNKDIAEHIARGGVSMPAEMSDAEAMQHVGGGKDEESGAYTGSVIKDPLAHMAQSNKKWQEVLKPEQHERKLRLDSAAAAQGKVRVRKNT